MPYRRADRMYPLPRHGRHRIAALGVSAMLAAAPAPMAASPEPPFDATADTVFDIIATGDASAFLCLEDRGREVRQMWDKRIDGERDLNAFLFVAHFSDSAPIDIVLNPEFGDTGSARAEAERYARPLGQLPALLRSGLRQFGIHKGDKGYHGGPGKVFVYSGKTDLRLSQDHLEESLFHEAVHASLDRDHARSDDWRAAQAADDAFVTRYAQEHPEGEDLAETALFAYGLIYRPGRIPPADAAAIRARVPARLAVLATILSLPPPAHDGTPACP
ncbi:hypothetical protein [Pukyongiella litopenaei]|uniref:Uncharacterized protein n=1 Tax=Pukyongiella litopenaei TaxID=2605946 RepID=A0A2S0MU68_9RHOB|nr:hypothetical protein [Pukyongiella litopenaei]AVO39418.2 hypothetical protein C6Y53_18120 [Pukyongiella litopenaei]